MEETKTPRPATPADDDECPKTPERGGEPDLPPESHRAWPHDKDLVDEAAEESFPASDPPSFHP